MSRLAEIDEFPWRYGGNVSPASRDPQVSTAPEAERVGGAGGQLELMAAGPVPRRAPRRDGGRDRHRMQVAIEEHDVDREAHAARVDAPQRVCEKEALPRLEPVAPEQAARCGDAVIGDAEPGNDDRAASCVE